MLSRSESLSRFLGCTISGHGKEMLVLVVAKICRVILVTGRNISMAMSCIVVVATEDTQIVKVGANRLPRGKVHVACL